jgi:hypothetical protein
MSDPTRPELQSLATALRALAKLLRVDEEPFIEIALGLDATLDAHLQRIEQLERRCQELADELSEARDRLNEIGGKELPRW